MRSSHDHHQTDMTSPDLDHPQHPLADLKDRVSAFLIDAVIFFIIVVYLTATIAAIAEKQTSGGDYSLFVLAVVLFCTTVLVQVIWGGLLEGLHALLTISPFRSPSTRAILWGIALAICSGVRARSSVAREG